MMKTVMLWLSGMCLLSCNILRKGNSISLNHYTVRDYVKVGKIMDTVKTPYVIDVRSKNGKRIVFIGCVHDAVSTHPQFSIIGKYFAELKPELVFNEGGQIPDNTHYTTINEAIQKDGETGLLKYYADKSAIKMLNGDMDARTEFELTLKKQPKEDLYLYYVIERIAIPYHYGAYPHENFDSVFNRIIAKYFIKNGFPLLPAEVELSYFKKLYKRKTGKVFDVTNFDLEAFDYINDHCKYCAVGRVSKMTRDSVLLSKIDAALNQYDRVLITFGHGHALAVEPALKEIVNRERRPNRN
ncbi:hypothetical protein [Pedobacter sp. KBW01]|uniref:hypothetical protein n=1 Tax=Pedobacter sp. KBW01 TaxID=2153364 RepID=UPI000F5B2D05|nr:hypothetical protein [Pedobacter sp. KBW01]